MPATDYSLATRMLAIDINDRVWDHELIRTAGLDPGHFATLLAAGTRLGKIDGEIARRSACRIISVAVGGHDHICGAMALGVNQPGTLLDSIGTAESSLCRSRAAVTDPQAGRKGYEMGAHVSGGYYAMPSFRTAGVCIEWFRETCSENADYAVLDAEACRPARARLAFASCPICACPIRPITIPNHAAPLSA